MAPRDFYRTLAKQLEGSFRTYASPTQRIPLYLTPGEWDLIVKALHQAAAPYATPKKAVKKPPRSVDATQSNGGSDATG